jgi:hypothetical protein
MKTNEKRGWIALLRSQCYPRTQEEKLWHDWRVLRFADVLEQRWFPKGGRPKKSFIAEMETNKETFSLARAVYLEIRALKKKGLSSGVKNAAIGNVAKRYGLGCEGLRRRLNGYGHVMTDGWGPGNLPIQQIHRRTREIRQIIDRVENDIRKKEMDAIAEQCVPRRRKRVLDGAEKALIRANMDWADAHPTLMGRTAIGAKVRK